MSDQTHKDVMNYYVAKSDLLHCGVLVWAGLDSNMYHRHIVSYRLQVIEHPSDVFKTALKWSPTDSGRARARAIAKWLTEQTGDEFEVLFLKFGANRFEKDYVDS